MSSNIHHFPTATLDTDRSIPEASPNTISLKKRGNRYRFLPQFPLADHARKLNDVHSIIRIFNQNNSSNLECITNCSDIRNIQFVFYGDIHHHIKVREANKRFFKLILRPEDSVFYEEVGAKSRELTHANKESVKALLDIDTEKLDDVDHYGWDVKFSNPSRDRTTILTEVKLEDLWYKFYENRSRKNLNSILIDLDYFIKTRQLFYINKYTETYLKNTLNGVFLNAFEKGIASELPDNLIPTYVILRLTAATKAVFKRFDEDCKKTKREEIEPYAGQ
jgi:hypothetical protein